MKNKKFFFSLAICILMFVACKKENIQTATATGAPRPTTFGAGGLIPQNVLMHGGGGVIFPFDYNSSGISKDLVLYAPGKPMMFLNGTIWYPPPMIDIENNNTGGNFSTVFSSIYGQGIGGFDLSNPVDKIIPFDYAGTGKLDYLFIYRSGTGGTCYILKNNSGNFTPVYKNTDLGVDGIGGYDLHGGHIFGDKVTSFDYDGTGKPDHLLLYRPQNPGSACWIVKNTNGVFSPVYQNTGGPDGIGGYDCHDVSDVLLPFDYDHSGKADHIVCYRPGQGVCWILKNSNGVFSPVFRSGNGIGGYDLQSGADVIQPFDYDHSGKQDYLILYRSGGAAFWILKNNNGNFTPVYRGTSLGDFDLNTYWSTIIPIDYDGVGRKDYLLVYTQMSVSLSLWNSIKIYKNINGSFVKVYSQ